jgi:NADH-quinone oxidoreductase subunit M
MVSLLYILIPIVSGALVFMTSGETAKRLSIASALATFAFTGYTMNIFDTNGSTQFVIDVPWIMALGSHFHIGIDGISMVMLILSNVVTLLVLLSTLKDDYEKSHYFYGLILIMQGAMNGVFVSLDLLPYYIFWELALIPAYFLVIMWGSKPIVNTGLKFFIYTLLGSLFMLAAIIYIGVQEGGSTDISSVYNLSLDPIKQCWIYAAFMIAYAIKIPIFPFHTWQPDTYQKAPAPVTIMLSAIMLKMALYSIIRWVIPVVPNAVATYGIYVIGAAAVGIVYASLLAWYQKDLKRVFAYSSIAHVGLIAAGILTVSKSGLDGAMVQMLAHAINAVGLFFVCHILYRAAGDHDLSKFGGLRHKAPLFAGFYLLVTMASVGLPLTNGFPGEFMLFNAVFNTHHILGIMSASGVILGAIYMLSSYQKVMLGAEDASNHVVPDADSNDKWVWIPLTILIILFGLFPTWITHISDPAIDQIIQIYQSKLNLIPTR